jgi:hypothetical protein
MKSVICDACEKSYRVPDDQLIPEGWIVPYSSFGYYEGFTDYLDDGSWLMCHDCIVKFLYTFPLLGMKVGRGQHLSITDDKPCCEFAWRPTELFGVYETINGELVRPGGAQIQIAVDGEWIDVPEPKTEQS